MWFERLMASRWVLRSLLICVTTSLMLADDFLQQIFSDNNLATIEPSYLLVIFVLNLLLWIGGHRWFALLVTALFAAMQLAQLTHISITGSPLAPYDIGKFFAASGEIVLALTYSWRDHAYLVLVWLLTWGACLMLFVWFLPRVAPRPSWIPLLLVVLIIGSKPERATRRDMIAFMPGPTRSSLHNSINVFSFYFARMAGREYEVSRPPFKPYAVRKMAVQSESPNNIVLLLVDSLRHDRLQISGYHRPNTPFLQTLQSAKSLQMRTGLASSVATGSSLPLFFNVVREPGNIDMINQNKANLFRHAKLSGYKTFWLSTQESKVLHGLGAKYIDVVKTLESDPLDIKLRGDGELVSWLQEKEWGDKNFIVILSRSVHSPYESNYELDDEAEVWSVSDSALPLSERMNNAYDNAILHFDSILEEKVEELKGALKGPSVLILTADHGQMLGEHNLWGHNRLQPNVASIPVLMHQWGNIGSQQVYVLPDNDYVSHYELGAWILSLMNFELHNPQYVADVHYFHGEDLYRDNLFRRVLESDRGFTFCDLNQVSTYHSETPCKLGVRDASSSGPGH